MKKNFGSKPWTYPQTVFIIASYDANGQPDAMNAAWCGIKDTAELGLCLAHDHKTVENILERKAFTVSIADASHVVACDYVGLISAKKEPNKVAKAGFTISKSEFVDAPVINELPMVIECRLKSYNAAEDFMVGEIVNVGIEESVLTDDGKNVLLDKLAPITYDPINHKYVKLGEVVGDAFSCGRELIKK